MDRPFAAEMSVRKPLVVALAVHMSVRMAVESYERRNRPVVGPMAASAADVSVFEPKMRSEWRDWSKFLILESEAVLHMELQEVPSVLVV